MWTSQASSRRRALARVNMRAVHICNICICALLIFILFILLFVASLCLRVLRFCARSRWILHLRAYYFHSLPGAFSVNVYRAHTQTRSRLCTPHIPQPVTQLCNLGSAASTPGISWNEITQPNQWTTRMWTYISLRHSIDTTTVLRATLTLPQQHSALGASKAEKRGVNFIYVHFAATLPHIRTYSVSLCIVFVCVHTTRTRPTVSQK